MHLFWAVVIVGIVWVIRKNRPELLPPIGIVLILVASLATSIVVARDLNRWFESVPEVYRYLWPRRVVYCIATLTDVPLIQSLLAGVFILFRFKVIQK
jgi:hypothetical protein